MDRRKSCDVCKRRIGDREIIWLRLDGTRVCDACAYEELSNQREDRVERRSSEGFGR